MKKAILSLLPLLLLAAPLAAKVSVDGRDFYGGASAVNVISYLNALSNRSQNFLFDFDSRWVAARFAVRSTDRYGLPLQGDAGDGSVDGSLLKYRLGIIAALEPKGNSHIIALFDYFIASHIDQLPGFLYPYPVFRDIKGSSLPIPGSALFDGGKAGGFASVAGQALLGADFLDLDLGEGLLHKVDFEIFGFFRFRDPIDSDGKFISTFWRNDAGSGYPADYYYGPGINPTNGIPTGYGGYLTFEPYLAVSVSGFKLNSLFSFEVGLGIAELFKSFRLEGTPVGAFLDRWDFALDYLNSAYSFFSRFNSLKTAQSVTLKLGFLELTPYADLALWPFRLNEARCELALEFVKDVFKLRGGAGWIATLNDGERTGWLGGLDLSGLSFTASYNYGEQLVGGIAAVDELVFSLSFRLETK